jgi:hypothetical protein
LRVKHTTLRMVAGGHKTVTASMAVKVARMVNLGIDQVLAGAFPPPNSCPLCCGGLPAPDLTSSVAASLASPTTPPMREAQRA